MTLATYENMMRARNEGIRCVAWSPNTFEEYSADPGDYWNAPKDWIMKDGEGEPMHLVVVSMEYEDVEFSS